MKRRVVCCLLAMAVALAAAACVQKFHPQKFELITVGKDDRYDVKHILGKPKLETADAWYYEDLPEERVGCIFFNAAGLVTEKRWNPLEESPWYQGRSAPIQ